MSVFNENFRGQNSRELSQNREIREFSPVKDSRYMVVAALTLRLVLLEMRFCTSPACLHTPITSAPGEASIFIHTHQQNSDKRLIAKPSYTTVDQEFPDLQ